MHPLLTPTLGLLILSGATLLIGRAGRDGALGRNRAVGIRTSATLASDAAWQAAHRAAAPLVQKAAAVAGTFAVVGIAAMLWTPPAWEAAVFPTVVVMGYAIPVALLVRAMVVADRAATEAATVDGE
ncbi:MAG TPA: SdpI family protein [Microcella sp.]|nr:SdpI family protein [Microcella sp.]